MEACEVDGTLETEGILSEPVRGRTEPTCTKTTVNTALACADGVARCRRRWR
jgi:hypothetical protein